MAFAATAFDFLVVKMEVCLVNEVAQVPPLAIVATRTENLIQYLNVDLPKLPFWTINPSVPHYFATATTSVPLLNMDMTLFPRSYL
jgi:hypothetical protein